MFTACALAHLGAGGLRVLPLARTSDRVRARVVDETAHISGLDLSALHAGDEAFSCHIRYDADGGKVEHLRGAVPALTRAELTHWLEHIDRLVVNFITGFETDLETLAWVRERVPAPLFMDLHSLTLGRHVDGRRFERPVPDMA